MHNILRKLRSVLPGASRTHAPPEEKTSLLENSHRNANAAAGTRIRLDELSDDQLAHLASQLGKTTNSLAAEARVRAEIVSRTNAQIETEVDRVLTQATKSVGTRTPQELAKYIHNAFINAQSILFKVSQPGEMQNATDFGKVATHFVAAGLGRLDGEDLAEVLRAMSLDDLAQISALDTNDANSTGRTQEAVLAARAEFAMRHTRFLADFEKHSRTLLALPATSDLNSLAQLQRLLSDLHNVGQSLHKLQALCKASGQPLPPAAMQIRDQVSGQVRAMRAGSEPNLAALTNTEISKLRVGLDLLGISLSPALLEKAAAERLAPLETGCQESAAQVLRGILNGSPEAVLLGLKALESGFNTLRDTETAFSSKLAGAQDSFNMRQKILSSALDPLSKAERTVLLQKLHAPETEALREALYAASDAASETGLAEASNSLNTLGAYIEECASLIDPDARLRTVTPQGTPPELSPAARDAFRTVLGIRWTANGAPVFGV
jgi:hypothetical protein